jgi:hypothetical protein
MQYTSWRRLWGLLLDAARSAGPIAETLSIVINRSLRPLPNQGIAMADDDNELLPVRGAVRAVVGRGQRNRLNAYVRGMIRGFYGRRGRLQVLGT